MKVKVTTDIFLDIPGEFQDDNLAISLIDETLRDMLCVNADYGKEDLPDDFLPITHMEITSYFVISGRVTQQDIDNILQKQRDKN